MARESFFVPAKFTLDDLPNSVFKVIVCEDLCVMAARGDLSEFVNKARFHDDLSPGRGSSSVRPPGGSPIFFFVVNLRRLFGCVHVFFGLKPDMGLIEKALRQMGTH